MQAMLWGTTETVAFTSSATAPSATMGSDTHIVRIMADADCFVFRGGVNDSPAAQLVGAPLLQGQTEYIQVTPRANKLFVRGMVGAGNLYITPCD